MKERETEYNNLLKEDRIYDCLAKEQYASYKMKMQKMFLQKTDCVIETRRHIGIAKDPVQKLRKVLSRKISLEKNEEYLTVM